ncbi:LLM class flavin-dependent oxidoreductase [Cryptosporangium sp. NPDC048952]|uniref:LLM class flavin-dependent oxidoreductase n=1 Tax=Cryptosporangium sp. NPDC048952 TaxID=3363961 RepID=UPI00371F4ED5
MTKLGYVLPTTLPGWAEGDDPRALLDLAVEAERLGVDSLWVGDTLLRPVVEPLTTLAGVAAVTSTIGLGAATLLPAFRRPVQAAHALASLDRLSGGRLTIAVGAGFPNRSEREYAISEVPWERRFARLDDTVALWRRLWAGETAFVGGVEVPPVLPPSRPGGPPIWLGGASPSALARVARHYDGWLPYPPQPGTYARGLATIAAAAPAVHAPGAPAAGALAAGRAVTPALFASVLIGDGGRAALDVYVRAAYGMPLEVVETIQLLIAGSPEHIREVLGRYDGVEHLVIRIAALDLPTQRDQLALLRRGI